jgi:hypothetical protein
LPAVAVFGRSSSDNNDYYCLGSSSSNNQHSNVKKNATTSSYKRVHVCCQATLQSNIYMGSVGQSVVVMDDAHFIHLDCFIVRASGGGPTIASASQPTWLAAL